MSITLSRRESRKVGVTSNDTTPDFLLSKIVAGSTKLTVAEANDGGDEDLTLDVDQTSIDHDLLLNFVANEHIDWTAASAGTIDPSNYVDNDTIYTHPNHTGEVTSVGDGAQAVDKTAITNQSAVTAAAGDEILIADADDASNLKKVTAQTIADLGGAGGAAVFAQLSSSVDQEPTVTTPVIITYNTQDDIAGLTHSTTVNPGEITIDTAGTYFILPQPQVGKDSGGAAQTMNMFLQIDRGSGFADEPNTNVKITISDNTATDVMVLGFSVTLAAGDKIALMQRITNVTVGLGIKFTAAETGPPTIPATPSIIFTMFRIGA